MAKIGRNSPCPCGSGRKHKHCCLHRDRAAGAPARPKARVTASLAERLPAMPPDPGEGYHWGETDLDRLSNSVVDLVRDGRLDEADAACEELRVQYPEVHDWLMRKAMVCEARGETEMAIEYCERTIAWMDDRPEDFDPESREPFRDDIARLRRSLEGA